MTKKFFGAGRSIQKISWIVLGLMLLLTALSVLTFSKLQTQYSLKQFLPKQNPLLALEERTKKTFQIAEMQPFIATLKIENSEGTWLDPDKLDQLRTATEELSRLNGAKSALSLATVQGAIDSKEGLTVGPLLQNIPHERWAAQVLKNALLTPALVSKDLRTASIIVNVKELSHSQLVTLKDAIAQQAQIYLPFAKVEIGGTPAVQTDISQMLQSEIRNFVGLGFLACLLVLFIVFANLAPVFIALVITVAANLMVLAAMALCGYSFTVLSTTIPILVTVTVMSLCIHSMLRLNEEIKSTPDADHAATVLRTSKLLVGPNFLASLTTIIGFLSLMTTKVPLIRDFGITVAMSVLITWAVTSILLVPSLVLLPAARARKWAWAKARWALYLFQKSGAWAFLIIAISVALAMQGQKLAWTARLFDDLPQDHQVRTSTETIDRELGGMIPIDVELRGGDNVWNDPKLLRQLDGLIQNIREFPGVGSAVGVPDLLAASNLTKSRLPASKASTAEIFFLFSLSEQSPLKNFLNADSSRTRIAIRTQDLPSDELDQLVSRVRTRASEKFPDLQVTTSGMGSTIHSLNNQLSKELIFGFWQSMLVIFIMLVFVFRSVRWSLIACVPNLVPPAALLGFLAISQTPIKPSIAIVFSIALGLAFNKVYLLGRLKSLQGGSAPKRIDIEKAMWLEGNPCLISSLTLLAGFSVFMISYFAMNRIFGFYMVLSMLAGLVGDLILLPTLLKSCPWLLTPSANLQKEKFVSKSAAMILIVLASLSNSSRAAVPNVTTEKIGHEIAARLNAKDEEFSVQMKIIEADGLTKERNMKITRLSPGKKEHYVMVRMQKPKDLKGTSLLASYKDGKEERWLYLPSSKQTRRLAAGTQEGSSILGSELSTDDFNLNTEQSSASTLKTSTKVDGKDAFVVESNVDKVSSNYSKVITTISSDQYLPMKAECFDKQGQLLKQIEFSDYKKIGSKWRASTIKIQNTQNHRGTEIALSDIKLDQNLKPSAFTPKALADE